MNSPLRSLAPAACIAAGLLLASVSTASADGGPAAGLAPPGECAESRRALPKTVPGTDETGLRQGVAPRGFEIAGKPETRITPKSVSAVLTSGGGVSVLPPPPPPPPPPSLCDNPGDCAPPPRPTFVEPEPVPTLPPGLPGGQP